jgi:hypothetical protein
MTISLVTFGCFFLYQKSKYFPAHIEFPGQQLLRQNKLVSKVLGYSLLFLALVLFWMQYGIATGLLNFVFSVLLLMSLLVICLPLNRNFLFLFIGLIITASIIDFI